MEKAKQSQMYFNHPDLPPPLPPHLHSPWTTVNSLLSGDVDRRLCDWWERATLFSSTLLLRGMCRRSSKIFNLVLFLSFILFFLILQPGATVTSDDTARTVTKWSAASVEDWEGTDWPHCLLLFVSLAVVCDLLDWREHWGWGLVYWSQKAMQILPFTKSDTVLTPCKWEICKPTAAGHECDTDRA